MQRLSSAKLSELIGLIYESALDPARWQNTIKQLSELFGGPGGIFVQDMETASAGFYVGTISEKFVRSYADHYAQVNPWLPRVKDAPSGTVVLAHNLLPPSEYEQTEFFNGWMRPQGVYHNSGLIIDNRADVLTNLTFSRARGDSAFGEVDTELYSLLRPHIQRAVFIHRRLFTLRAITSSTLEAFERLSLGVALVSDNGRIHFVNKFLLRLIKDSRGLADRFGTLHATNQDCDRRFQRLVASAIKLGSDAAIGGSLSIQGVNGEPLSVLVTPFNIGPPHNEVRGALIFVSDPMMIRTPRAAELRALFHLTNAESGLLSMLLDGSSLKDYSDAKHVSMNTTRTLLKRVFEKTGKARQSDLMRLGWSNLIARLAADD